MQLQFRGGLRASRQTARRILNLFLTPGNILLILRYFKLLQETLRGEGKGDVNGPKVGHFRSKRFFLEYLNRQFKTKCNFLIRACKTGVARNCKLSSSNIIKYIEYIKRSKAVGTISFTFRECVKLCLVQVGFNVTRLCLILFISVCTRPVLEITGRKFRDCAANVSSAKG